MIKVIPGKYHQGFVQTVNKGVKFALEAGAEYILILNNDTIVDKSMVEQLVETLRKAPTAGIASPSIYYYDWPEMIWQSGDRQLLGPIFTKRINEAVHEKRPIRADYVPGCAMLVKREVFEIIGDFDETYVMYFEDADFCQRVRSAGFDILVIPWAKMWHKVSLSTRNIASIRIYHQMRSRVIFLNRHTSSILRIIANLYIWMRLISEAGSYLLQGKIDLTKSVIQGALAGYASL
jgi:hypothetical protein